MARPLKITRMPRPRRPGRWHGGMHLAGVLVAVGVVAAVAWPAPRPDAAGPAVTVLHGRQDTGIATEVAVFRGGNSGRAAAGFGSVAGEAAAVTVRPVAGVVFTPCGIPSYDNCVVDGDTFHLGGRPIRLVDVDAPEVRDPSCMQEAETGARAKARLMALLNEGAFSLEVPAAGDHDRYGRELRRAVRDGQSLGTALVAEGLAQAWDGPAVDWCG